MPRQPRKGTGKQTTPWIAFSNETLEKLPKLGKTAKCPKCKADCEVKDAGTMQYISHCGSEWMVGVEGKDISNVKADASGRI